MVVCFHGGLDFIPGYEAVMVFFVLSGYFVSSSIFKSISENRWSWKLYLINRITRLWVVLIPALLLSAFWGGLQISLLENDIKVKEALSLELFINNLLFLQGINSGVFGLNGPLWSLSYEFWYYILFPFIILLYFDPKKSHKIGYLLGIFVLVLFLGLDIMKYFLVWLLGATIPLIKPMKIKSVRLKRSLIIFSSILAIIAINTLYLIYHSNHAKPQYLIDLFVGITFAFWLYLLVNFFNEKFKKSIFKIDFPYYCRYFAGISYTLYLTHYPIMLFIELFYDKLAISNEIIDLALKLTTFIIILVYAWAISRLTEANTEKVRRYFIKGILGERLKKVA
jgi:peptidoglycan/LPS O-acetylase OafA/YrhL